MISHSPAYLTSQLEDIYKYVINIIAVITLLLCNQTWKKVHNVFVIFHKVLILLPLVELISIHHFTIGNLMDPSQSTKIIPSFYCSWIVI